MNLMRLLASTICVSLLVAACGDSSGDNTASTGSTNISTESTARPSDDAAPATTGAGSVDPGNEQTSELDLAALPLGDGRISDNPEVGSVFVCATGFGGGGAQVVGPWIDTANSTWDSYAKDVQVDGSVVWSTEFLITSEGGTRLFEGNNLPGHPTGEFPVAASDDAYEFDRNPNSIQAQDLNFELPRSPSVAEAPSCVGMGAIGVLLTGGVFFNGLDARGEDAVAHEIQDKCQGHPEASGTYHYHSLSTCLEGGPSGAHSGLMGYAFDGFGLFGRYSEGDTPITNAELDVCHGHTHEVEWDGSLQEMYHYHATWEYPYTVSCFTGEPQL